MRVLKPVFFLALCSLQVTQAHADLPRYVKINLDSEGSFSVPYALNNQGQVVGFTYSEAGPYAFLYSDGAMTALGTLGGNISGALDINDSGQIVGWSETASGAIHGFTYSNGSMLDFGGVQISAINNSGQLLLVNADGDVSIYTGGDTVGISGVSGSDYYASALNNLGQVVGNELLAGGVWRALLYFNGEQIELGTLGGTGGEAYDINDAMQIVGQADAEDGMKHAFLFQSGIMIDLGTLGGSSLAHGINNSGLIVGDAVDADGVSRAVLFSDGAVLDLNALIVDGDDTLLSFARGINDAGQIIALGADGRTYLLNPVPLPAAAGLFASGLLGLAAARRRFPAPARSA